MPNQDLKAWHAQIFKFKVPKTDTTAVKNSDGRETGKSEGSKRSSSSSSERSGASKSNERKSRPETNHKLDPPSGPGVKLLYGNEWMDLIESSNKYAVKMEVLNNRKESLVCLVSGTIAQNTDPPTCHSF